MTVIDTNEIILIAAPEILAIPVQENHDPLIDIRQDNQILIGPSPEIPDNTDYTKMRSEVYRRLLSAQKALPDNLKFCLYEGYRSLSLQKTLFEERYRQIAACHPDWRHQQLFNETMKLISPVLNLDGTPNIPPHATGAAIDVYLVDQNDCVVDMGLHPADWLSDTDALLSETDCKLISDQAKKYRRIMCQVLGEAGFVNYPTEYWHWSYGDRYWAYMTGREHAIYGCYF
ncbi:M15 family metallopeptidase [Legionella dresdenensis]|uniref:M15 family metallopeptidase n=1 Tax=Legionella dresdenensis TaxID=450200 RepID=A0ABV8CCG2_9GAMM